jgi:hypothetical protein
MGAKKIENSDIIKQTSLNNGNNGNISSAIDSLKSKQMENQMENHFNQAISRKFNYQGGKRQGLGN